MSARFSAVIVARNEEALAASAFRFRFVVSKGYRDGVAGLVLSVLFAFDRFEVEAKTWEAAGYRRDADRTVRRHGLPSVVGAPGRAVRAPR
jgi:hypothetical protein